MTGDILARLQAAQSDAEREWVVMEWSLANLELEVQEAVWAAAVPHWFDAAFLAALLDKPLVAAQPVYHRLTTLSFVESFPGRGYNVHERTRNLLLDRLWHDDRERYLLLSRRAAAFCAKQDQDETAWRVETIYHRLIVEPDAGASDLQNMGWTWQNAPNFAYDKVEAMARAGREHLNSGRLSGRAAGWTLYWEAHLDTIYSRNHSAKQKLLAIDVPADQDTWLAADSSRTLGRVHTKLAEYAAARGRYEEALSIYRGIGDRRGEADCIRALGRMHSTLAEYVAARGRYEEALPIYRGIGDRKGEADCIRALGRVHARLAEYVAARQRYEEALPIHRAVGDRKGEANCIKALGDVHVELTEYGAARGRYEEALPIYRGIGARLGEANCIKALGEVHERLAEYAAARRRYEEALQIYRAIGVRLNEANCIKALGDVHVRLAEYGAARERYVEALPIYRAIGVRLNEANCIQGLGDVHVQLSEYQEARARYEEALLIFRAIGARLNAADCIKALGDVHTRLAEYAAARGRYEEALPIYRAIGSRLGEANCIKALGDVHVRLAEYAVARGRYEELLPIYRAIGDRLGETNCIKALGDVSLEQGDEAAALAAYQDAFERHMALGLPNDAANVLNSQTSIYDRRKEYALSLTLHTRAIELAPANPVWYLNRALCYIDLRDAERALADLETAARLQPDHPYLHLRRGDVALLQKEHADAAQHYAAFVGVLPRNTAGHYGLAKAHFGQHRTEEALASLKQALELTYAQQEVLDAIDDLIEMRDADPGLSDIDHGVALLREWLAQRQQ